jgi:magnesium-transporting ATPase (P-type)
VEEMNITVDESKYGGSKCVEKEPSALREDEEGAEDIEGDQEPDNHKEVNPDNCLLTGTMVMSGGGKAVVCSVGPNTVLGRMGIKQELNMEGAEKTPLKKKLEDSCTQISKYCIFATIVIVIAQVFNLIIVIMVDKDSSVFSANTMMKIIHIMIIAICILIVAIPEGMPLAVSLAMALSIDKLKDDSILIKNLEAIQICATLHDVCIGKTGTLTVNRMNVSKVCLINE